jgi:hypothetical protein
MACKIISEKHLNLCIDEETNTPCKYFVNHINVIHNIDGTTSYNINCSYHYDRCIKE